MPPDTTTSPPPRMSGEDRRRQLIEVAIDLFSRRGFSGATTKEIAAAAGVTEAIIFRHFATKQDLYKAILDYRCNAAATEEWFAEVQALMDANDDEGMFRFLLTKIVEFHREQPQFARLLMHAALEGHEIAIMHRDQLKRPLGAKFKDYVTRRQAAGAIRECDPTLVIFAVVGFAEHYAMHKYMCGEGMPLSDEDLIEGGLRILMDGLKIATPKRKSK